MKSHKDTWNIIHQVRLIIILTTFFYFSSRRPTYSVQHFISITHPFYLHHTSPLSPSHIPFISITHPLHLHHTSPLSPSHIPFSCYVPLSYLYILQSFFQVFAKTKFCMPLFLSYTCYMPFSFRSLLNHTIHISNSFHATVHFVIFFSLPMSSSLLGTYIFPITSLYHSFLLFLSFDTFLIFICSFLSPHFVISQMSY
jgi:hypothetical protein